MLPDIQPLALPDLIQYLLTRLRDLAVLACVPALLGFLGGLGWFLDLFAHFRWQYALILTLGILAALMRERPPRAQSVVRKLEWHPWTLGTLLIVWLANACVLVSANGPVPVAAPTSSAGLKVLVVNIHLGNTDPSALLALIEQEAPDVVGILELTPDMSAKLTSLDDQYPHSQREPRDDPFGIAVWWRAADRSVEQISSPPLGFPSLRLTLILDGKPLNIWMTHPCPPMGAQMHAWRAQQLQELAARIAAMPGEHVLAGDLNASPWSIAYRELRTTTGMLDAGGASLPRPTWHGGGTLGWLFAVPIDYALVTPGLSVSEYRIGPDIGSDHRPLIVHIGRADRRSPR
jgi:endonuclease/exonuclease/phosphatase (EEP) superfamily protein YafD